MSDIGEAWDANVRAVQDAKAAVAEALRQLTAADRQLANTLRARRYPTDAEIAAVDRTREAWRAAKEAEREAGIRFKAGVVE